MHLEWAGAGAAPDGRSYTERMRGRSDVEIAGEFVQHVRGVAAREPELELLARALGAADRAEAAR